MVRELDTTEQRRMTIDEAGEIYKGYFIFFTNSEEPLPGTREEYAVPRAICANKKEFYDSGIFNKYKNQNVFGVPYFCSVFMSEEEIPGILTF